MCYAVAWRNRADADLSANLAKAVQPDEMLSVARHGEFVLLCPRFEWQTALLGLTPLILLLGGAFSLLVLARLRSRSEEPASSRPRRKRGCPD
jgi:cytochrome c-type biogenesis protein CcmH/NrfF